MYMVLVVKGKKHAQDFLHYSTLIIMYQCLNLLINPPSKGWPSLQSRWVKVCLFGLSLSGFSISSDSPITDWFGLIWQITLTPRERSLPSYVKCITISYERSQNVYDSSPPKGSDFNPILKWTLVKSSIEGMAAPTNTSLTFYRSDL